MQYLHMLSQIISWLRYMEGEHTVTFKKSVKICKKNSQEDDLSHPQQKFSDVNNLRRSTTISARWELLESCGAVFYEERAYLHTAVIGKYFFESVEYPHISHFWENIFKAGIPAFRTKRVKLTPIYRKLTSSMPSDITDVIRKKLWQKSIWEGSLLLGKSFV